ncbi:MAG: response regulator [Anaerolineae bacterium]
MSKATLLIVEDEPNLLLGIRDILELDGYRVLTAHNGQQALDRLNSAPHELPDLIVSDIMMPQMDGIQFLTEVRKKDDWVTIPVIFLTAKGEKLDIQNGKRLGVDDYLVKPFDADELLVAVEAKIRRSKDLDRVRTTVVEKVKRSILTILNHEFRTPLTLVVAYADMLKDTDVESMSETELLMFLREINLGADRLRRLVENFILLVELETGDAKRTFDWRKNVIHDLGEIITGLYRQMLDTERMLQPCTLDFQPELPAILGDRDYLLIILRELLDNAIKFSKPDDPITISVTPTETHLQISIVDTGRGIPPDELAHIWDMFYQVNRDHFEDQGAGSGLAIVRLLTELHGGRVEATSAPDKGSCFTVVLPLHPKD